MNPKFYLRKPKWPKIELSNKINLEFTMVASA